jgi:CubicO group peptidase (beta-lactamase class C family)
MTRGAGIFAVVWIVCVLTACGEAHRPPAEAPSASLQPAPTAAAKPSRAPRATRLQAETRLQTGAGATFTAPAGWHLTRHPGHLLLEGPDREVELALVELEGASAEAAIGAAWKRVRPGFKLQVKHRSTPPARRGWEAVAQLVYETPSVPPRLTLAVARRKGARWYVALLDGTQAAFDRRGANIHTMLDSFKAPGVEEESWAGRAAHPLDAKRLQSFTAFVEQARQQAGVPGAALAVVQGGKVVLARGFGVRALGRRAQVTPKTLFLIGSTTKSLTTLMMACLVDRKRFDWDTPVVQLLPSFALADPQVTAVLTLQNTVCACAGLPRQDLEFLFEYAGVTPEQRVASMKTMRPTTGFGETFQYSNSMVAAGGYVAAHALRPKQALGPAYDAAIRQLVFRPLGMRSTTLSFAAAKRAEHALPHAQDLQLQQRRILLSDEEGVVPVRPAGGAWSNVQEMARYLLLELGEGQTPEGKRVVSAASLLKRREPQVKISNKLHYGLGLFVEQDHGVQVVHHGGNNAGFTSDMFFLPKHGLGAVLLTNAGSANAFRRAVRRRLLELVFDGREQAQENLAFALKRRREVTQKELERITLAPDRAWLKGLAGRYSNPGLGVVTLRLAKDKAVLDVGEWKTAVARKQEKDGVVKLYTVDPPWVGLELIPEQYKGGTRLVLEAGQHRYVFEPAR